MCATLFSGAPRSTHDALEEAETDAETDAEIERDKPRGTSREGPRLAMGLQEKINANPTVYAVAAPASKKFDVFDDCDEDSADPFEPEEIFGAFVLAFRLLLHAMDAAQASALDSDSLTRGRAAMRFGAMDG